MNSLSNYKSNNSALSNNLEKLSSGYKINSAADDAAGLAISEKMRSQIAGLEKAQDNANDGISLVQTAEGALTEVNSMLTRLTTLATQSANGTYEDGVDRANIQEETDALLSEIDRISQSTNFNGIKLLDGSLSGKSQVSNVAITESTAVTGKFTTGGTVGSGTAAPFTALTASDIGKTIDYTVTWKDADGTEKTTTAKLTYQGQGDGTVANTGSATEAVKNYFTDDQGNKYKLSSSNTLSASQVQNAIKAGLENNEEFSSNFKVTVSSNKFKFETKATGAETATITGTAAEGNLTSATVNTAVKTQIGAGGNVTVDQKAADALQKFDATKLTVAKKGDTASKIDAATFEIDGNKFVVASSNWSDADTRKLGSDVTLIKLSGASVSASADISNIAAVVQKQTGRKTEVATNDTARNLTTNDIVFTDSAKDKLKTSGNELTLQIGDTAESYQQVNVKIQDMSSKGLGLKGLDLSTQETASKSIDTIKQAVNAVSSQRGQLGALQNRLDHTLNSLDATNQNITAAESQIRDTDMAKEMTQYSKNNILAQAAQSMLAQANSMPQGVLSLLG
jgi:flagellin